MQHIELSDQNVVPLTNIAPNVKGLRIIFVNVFGITNADGSWTLIDAGLPLSTERIRHWVDMKFSKPPAAIVLTHGHFDHIGAVKDLAESWRVPVYAHPLEAPFLTGKQQYPPPDPTVGGGIMSVMSPLYPRGPIDITHHLEFLPNDGSIPTMPSWKCIHTPGHTVGHVSFFRESDRTLLVGDAFCTTDQQSFLKIAVQNPELNGPPAYFTPDWDAAGESVRKLAVLKPATLAPGHGLPMTGERIAEKLDTLAQDFDRIARPKHHQRKEPAA
jgi:glyoxylase-like metal-dependent hydrolase (beta-lactamase superfamily II)